MADLPTRTARGRSGTGADAIVAKARVARTVNVKAIRADLAHIGIDMPRKEMDKLVSKYRCLPEMYYQGEAPVGPDDITRWMESQG